MYPPPALAEVPRAPHCCLPCVFMVWTVLLEFVSREEREHRKPVLDVVQGLNQKEARKGTRTVKGSVSDPVT